MFSQVKPRLSKCRSRSRATLYPSIRRLNHCIINVKFFATNELLMTFFDCKIHVLLSRSFNSLLDVDELQNQQGVVRSLADLKHNCRNQEYG